ncbi:FAD binding domain-containing protein [Actinomadura scrupuli]|uniref:FAD binding domain-containing protein n=1 Tax=Actinomadura scrupuli TaxID=559629 RepID=UPI003D983C1C
MRFLRPVTWEEALAAKAGLPGARAIAGGTDVMVEMNFGRPRPDALLDLTAIPELSRWDRDGETVRLGAGVPYSRVIEELGEVLPGLAMASRTVGSPQIRNRGTVGGNLGSASPAGDAHPPLLATGATVEVESVRGARAVPIGEFFQIPPGASGTAPPGSPRRRSILEPDELIRAVRVPVAAGPQQFSKIGTRNAMVIAVCSFSLALDPAARRAGTGIGSAAPTPVRAREAEELLARDLDWDGPLDEDLARRFGALVAAAASPIDDVRGTAAYRRHALSVLARRTLHWTWEELRCA